MMTKRATQPAADGIMSIYDTLAYQRLRAEIMAIEARLAEAEAAKKRELSRLRGAPIKRSAGERAIDLVRGGKIDPTSAAAAAQAHEEEVYILRDAIGEKTRELDRFVADLSYDVTASVKPQYDAAMRRALAAMSELAAAFRDAAGVADELRTLGYKPSSQLLPSLFPQAVLQLGDPDAVGMSEAWRFRRELKNRGII
jgi:hypothetical protein